MWIEFHITSRTSNCPQLLPVIAITASRYYNSTSLPILLILSTCFYYLNRALSLFKIIKQTAPTLSSGTIKDKLKSIKSLCIKHKMLCCAFSKWINDIEQNDAQLKILNKTAVAFRNRHKVLTEKLTHSLSSPELLSQLQREISAVKTQVTIWILELAEINDDRTKLDIEFVKLQSQLEKSLTNIMIAQLDFETMEKHYCDMWKKLSLKYGP